MFSSIIELEKEMNEELSNFLKELFEKNKYKYFYDKLEELQKLSGLKFTLIKFNTFDKKILEKIKNYKIRIEENEYSLKIEEMSIRGEFKISNISKLTKEKKKKQYIKEYLFYYILKSIEGIDPQIISTQKNNFLYLFFQEYNSIEFKKLKKEKYIKAIDSIAYYQKLKENSLIKYLYINKSYSNKLEIIFTPENTDDILFSFNKILISINSASKDNNKKYFYRGQNNSLWLPSASIAREKRYLENEHLMFYKIISKMPKSFEKDKYIYNQIATMQHFGYPTRLIDITENPLIALYFACEGNNEVDGEIFVYEADEKDILNFESKELRCLEKIPTKKINELCEECIEKEKCKKEIIEKSYIVQGVAQNERINNQSGSFIFVGVSRNEKYSEQKIQTPIKHIIIDKKLKLGILEILEKLNINGGTVYPDLLNLAKFLKEKYKNE